MNYVKGIASVVGVLLSIVVLSIFFNGLDFGLTKIFASKYEQVRRETFEQGHSYNEGMVRDLENLRNQYLSATDEASKSALRATFIHRAEGYTNQLPFDLQQFYNSIKG